MRKKWYLAGCIWLCTLIGITAVAFAITVLTEEEAMKQVFPPGVEIETETKTLSSAELKEVQAKLGGKLVYEQEGSESATVREERRVTFHFAKKDGNRIGVAIVDTQPGKWGPVTFMTALDLKGTVKAVRVLSYEEQRGQPIARLSFLNQYRGKNVNSTLTVGRDIVGVSGATISSRSATFAVKKALVIFRQLYEE